MMREGVKVVRSERTTRATRLVCVYVFTPWISSSYLFIMAEKQQRLVLSIIEFLNQSIENGTIKQDDKESLEVAGVPLFSRQYL